MLVFVLVYNLCVNKKHIQFKFGVSGVNYGNFSNLKHYRFTFLLEFIYYCRYEINNLLY